MKIISRQEAILEKLTTYHTGKPCKRGHISSRSTANGCCLECVKLKKRSVTLAKIVSSENLISRPEAKLKGTMFYFTGKLCSHGHLAKRYTSTGLCVECNKSNSKSRRISHPEYMKSYNESYKTRRNNRKNIDADHRCLLRMRCMVRRMIRSKGIHKTGPTIDMLGYTPTEFKSHIESLFTAGMSWGNHGEWHIDHKIPLSKLIEYGYTDPALVNGLWNLQPLWASDNLSKSNKM